MSNTSFLEHISDLRKTVFRCVLAFIIFYPVGFFLAPYCINLLVSWTFPENMQHLSYFTPMEVFILQLKLGGIIAFFFAFPYTLLQILKFLSPALYDNERKLLKWSILTSSFLFILGAFFCLYLMLPLVIKFSLSFSTPQLQPVLGVGNFINLCSWLMLAFGIMFQFPMLVIALVKLGIISVKSLKDKRPYIIVIILILSALLTPPDVISQILLALPTYILFEVGLFFARNFEATKG
ncbi:MAG: twin-arginine translocase subunit TatC [Elusimicrobiota bacterium]|jgi:sec-independent protein translocase protein TatC|nr:twin-arginine translocase subunit TatC [Elusimicrobiota bacterium]